MEICRPFQEDLPGLGEERLWVGLSRPVAVTLASGTPVCPRGVLWQTGSSTLSGVDSVCRAEVRLS